MRRTPSGGSNSSCRIPKTSSCTTRPTGTCSAGRSAPSPPAASGWSGRWTCSTSRWKARRDGTGRGRAACWKAGAPPPFGLARSLPVRLHYTTAVVEEGEVRVRPDIYGLDEAYARAMDASDAPPLAAAGRAGARRRHALRCAGPRFACPCCWRSRAVRASAGARSVRTGLAGLGLAGLGGSGGAALAQAVASGGGGGSRRLAIERVQTGETFDGIYWSDGRYDRDALRRLDWVFRDPSMEEATPMDPRLFDVLHSGCAAARRDRGLPGRSAAIARRRPTKRGRGHRGAFRASACTCRAWPRMCGCRGATPWPWRGSPRRCRWAASGSIAAMASCTWIAARPGAGRPGSRTSAAPVLQHRGASGGQGRRWFGRRRTAGRLPGFRREPPGEGGVAAIAGRRGRRVAAFRLRPAGSAGAHACGRRARARAGPGGARGRRLACGRVRA